MIKARQTNYIFLTALLVALSLPVEARQLPPLGPPVSFGPGDLLVSLEPGPVVWFNSAGTLQRVLIPTVTGLGEGMAFECFDDTLAARPFLEHGSAHIVPT